MGMMPRWGKCSDVEGQREGSEQEEERALCAPLWDRTGWVDLSGGACVHLDRIQVGAQVWLQEALERKAHLFPDGFQQPMRGVGKESFGIHGCNDEAQWLQVCYGVLHEYGLQW